MNSQNLILIFLTVVIVTVFSTTANAQSNPKLGGTFSDKVAQSGNDIIEQFLKSRENKNLKSNPKNPSATKFKPAGNSGVAESIADALAQNAEQKTALVEAFHQIKSSYEAEVASQGKSNDLAAAFTFFIASNVMTYYQTDPPSDKATDELFSELQSAISNVPAFAEMNDLEKQKMHDWLVCMGGFAMTNYADAKQSGNSNALATIKAFVAYSLRLVLGIEAEKLSFSSNGLNVSTPNSQSTPNEIIGIWATASSSPAGPAGTIDATRKQMVNAGILRLSYTFNADGTYSFKSERSPTSNVWWTTEETGTYAVNGSSLTVSPKTSKATLRNLNGVVQETKSNPLEKVTYQWKTHFFAGNAKTNLVLEPAKATNRDGILGTNSLFPNAYLYVQGFKPEWRF